MHHSTTPTSVLTSPEVPFQAEASDPNLLLYVVPSAILGSILLTSLIFVAIILAYHWNKHVKRKRNGKYIMTRAGRPEPRIPDDPRVFANPNAIPLYEQMDGGHDTYEPMPE